MQRSKSIGTAAIVLAGVAALLGGGTTPAAAQTYVCPPGYYFLANYGCYPFHGYPQTYYAPPPPPIYPYPAYPYMAPWGFSFQFGGPGGRGRDGHSGGHR